MAKRKTIDELKERIHEIEIIPIKDSGWIGKCDCGFETENMKWRSDVLSKLMGHLPNFDRYNKYIWKNRRKDFHTLQPLK